MEDGKISVFLADDNIIVREGVRALLQRKTGFEVVGAAADYDELVAGAIDTHPDVVVTDIRMPPSFQREGIDAAKEVRKRHPGTGVVILSQYDDPEYAISLLAEGRDGYSYLLKDRIAEGDQLSRAIKTVAAGGSYIDPHISETLARTVTSDTDLSDSDEELLKAVAEGRTIKSIAVIRETTPAAAAEEVERLFLRIAQSASSGAEGSIRKLRLLHQAIVDREEQGQSLSRLLPGGLAEKVAKEGHRIGQTEDLEVTVLMSDIRGYTSIAERAEPAKLAHQLNTHRAEMNRAILDNCGTVMQFVGDAVMAVFGAPLPQDHHADHALAAAAAMHERQSVVNQEWEREGLAPFGLGIGLSTGKVAGALLGSEERLEYTIVGDTVNLTQRLQQFAAPGETVLSEATVAVLSTPVEGETLREQVKGRQQVVIALKLSAR